MNEYDLVEVYGLKLDGPTYRDITRLSENSGRGITGEIAEAVHQYTKAKNAVLTRIAKAALKDELEAMEQVQGKHDEAIVAGGHFDTDLVVAAKERLNNAQ
jgi:hypothetical protein